MKPDNDAFFSPVLLIMMEQIRQARQADARAIRGLIYRVGINPVGLAWQRFVVAVDARGRLIGCGQIKPHRDGSAELASIAVQPEMQRQGIGRAIVEHLLAGNPGTLYLTCQLKNEPFYQKFGFQTIGPRDMPPYFRQINRLAALFAPLVPSLRNLRIMVKKQPDSYPPSV